MTAVARGDAFSRAPRSASLASPLPGVADAAWARFVRALAVAPVGAVDGSESLGAYRTRPRRLADLGLMRPTGVARNAAGRTVWRGEFVAPLTREEFLRRPGVQYRALVLSCRDWLRRVLSGEVKVPVGMSLSGALAALHRAGPGGLKGEMFPETRALYERAKEIF